VQVNLLKGLIQIYNCQCEKNCNIKNKVTNTLIPRTFILNSKFTWHMGSTCYTSDLQVVTKVVAIDIYASVPPWHQRMYPGLI